MNSRIDKKLAERIATTPGLREKVEACLAEKRPLWTLNGNWPDEEVVRATLAAMKK